MPIISNPPPKRDKAMLTIAIIGIIVGILSLLVAAGSLIIAYIALSK